MLLFEERYKGSDRQEFLDKVNKYSYRLGIDPNWLMYVMYHESGLNPRSQATYYKFIGCGGGYAGGLIGFTPCTQKGLGFTGTPDDFVKLSGSEQMEYVYKLYKPYSGRINNYADLALVTAFPVALGKPMDWVFQSPSEGVSASEYVKGNPAFDLNKDNKVTLSEFYEYQDNKVRQVVPESFIDKFIDKGTNEAVEWNVFETHKRDLVIGGLVVAVLAMIITVSIMLARSR